MNINDLLILDEQTGEMLEPERVVEEYIKIKNLTVNRKKETIDKLMIKLEECADDLSKEDILRIAKKLDHPINSFYKFYMVSLSPYYMDLDMSKGASRLLNKMLKLVANGHLVDRYSNNKPIKTLKGLYESLGITKTVFHNSKTELEKLRLIKCYEGKDSYTVLFNPIYIRCGNMNEFTFFEFEKEIKEYNYLEWLYYRKCYNLSGSLRIDK